MDQLKTGVGTTCWEKLDELLNGSNLVLFNQAIVDSKTQLPIKYEVLVRVKKLNGGMVPLGNFFKLIEDFELEEEFDLYLLDFSLRQIALYRTESVKYQINVYPRTLMNPNFTETVKTLCSKYGIDLTSISLELIEAGDSCEVILEKTKERVSKLTSGELDEPYCPIKEEKDRRLLESHGTLDEEAEAANYKIVNYNIESLAKLGLDFYIDDYPSGNNNKRALDYIRGFRGVKIDGNLIISLFRTFPEEMFLNCVRDMVKQIRDTLGDEIEITVENVETKRLCELLSLIDGISNFQGYYFDKPKQMGPQEAIQ